MRIIGLTGGIASGKSTVAHVLEELGIPVIDADHLARRAVERGTSALSAITSEFGSKVIKDDGTLDRPALAKIVFSDPEKLKRLEAITHPAIRQLAEEELNNYRAKETPAVVYMAPLLIEAGLTAKVDEVWVVYADEETQIRRVMGRDNSSRKEALARIAAQMPMDEKAKLGKVVIDNRGTLADLEQQVKDICHREFPDKNLNTRGG